MKRFGIILVVISIYMGSFAATQRSVPRSTTKVAKNSVDFRKKRKVGIGVGAAGAYGLVGSTIELNFSPETSFATHFGIAKHYQSFGLSIKQIIGGKWFAPYIAGGFTRWYTAADKGPIQDTTPGFLAEEFLSPEEKRSGKFAATLFYPALGIQYVQLDGDWAGTSLFAEVLMLVDIAEFKSAPTGSLGMLYYF